MEPYLGEIRPFAGTFAPAGWMFCNGQALAIAEFDALYALLGTTYGGDGVTTFNLPNLQSRIPIGQGQAPGQTNRVLGQMAGNEMETLTTGQMPQHNHVFMASSAVGHLSNPAGATPAVHRDFAAFSGVADTPMASSALSPAGGNQPHDNMPPTLVVSFIIAVYGIFPSRS